MFLLEAAATAAAATAIYCCWYSQPHIAAGATQARQKHPESFNLCLAHGFMF